jgi:Phage tail repeat like
MVQILRPSFGDVRVRRREPMDNDFFDRRFKLLVDTLNTVITELEGVTGAGDNLVQLGLARINETLTPALVKINAAAELGFLIGVSTTPLTLVEGQEAVFQINEATRELFSPTPYLTITRSDPNTEAQYAVARLVAWNAETGGLDVDIISLDGISGEQNDWIIAASAGIAPGVIARAGEVAVDAAQVAADRLYIESVVDDIQNGPVISVAGKTGAVALELGDVANLVTTLAGKVDTAHTHAQSDVTGLVTALAGKAGISHTHPTSEVTGLDTALAGKVAASGGALTGALNAADQEVSGAKLKDYAITVNARGSVSGAQAIDYSLGNYVTATIAGATQFSVTNPPSTGIAGSFVLALNNGGSQTITWMSGIKWPGGIAPSLTVSGLDLLSFNTIDGGTTWRGSLAMRDVK